MLSKIFLLNTFISLVVATSFLDECEYYKLVDSRRKYLNCDENNFIVEKLRNAETREDFWCITLAEDTNDREFEIDFSGPWAIEARGIEKPIINGNSITFANQLSAELVRLVIKRKNRKRLPEILSLRIDGEEKCGNGKKKTTTPRPAEIGEFDSIFNININVHCGQRKTDDQKLIAGGVQSKDGSWPWHVAIYHLNEDGLGQSYKCGGSILEMDGIKFVVTAAHCVYVNDVLIPNIRIKVKAGIVDLLQSGQEYSVFRVYKHPDYNDTSNENDIAILALNEDLQYSNKIQPVCFPKIDISTTVSNKKYVIGFGVTENNILSTKLLEIQIKAISHDDCISRDEQFFSKNLFDTNYCAVGSDTQTACKGDSGSGSFEEDENETFYLQGVVSFTKASKRAQECNTKSPVVFTNVYKYENWIKEVVDRIRRNKN